MASASTLSFSCGETSISRSEVKVTKNTSPFAINAVNKVNSFVVKTIEKGSKTKRIVLIASESKSELAARVEVQKSLGKSPELALLEAALSLQDEAPRACKVLPLKQENKAVFLRNSLFVLPKAELKAVLEKGLSKEELSKAPEDKSISRKFVELLEETRSGVKMKLKTPPTTPTSSEERDFGVIMLVLEDGSVLPVSKQEYDQLLKVLPARFISELTTNKVRSEQVKFIIQKIRANASQ